MSQDCLKGCTKGNNFETSDYVYNIGQAGIVQLRADAGGLLAIQSRPVRTFLYSSPYFRCQPAVFLLYSLQKYRKCRTLSIIRAAFDRITPRGWYFDTLILVQQEDLL